MHRILYRISQTTAALMVLGWAVVIFTALFMKGGHPPLSAYAGAITMVSSWVLGSAGTLCGLVAIRGPEVMPARVVVLNAALLAFAVLAPFL